MYKGLTLMALLAMAVALPASLQADEQHTGAAHRGDRRGSDHVISRTAHRDYKGDKEASKRERRKAKREEIQARKDAQKDSKREPHRRSEHTRRMSSKKSDTTAALNEQIDALNLKVESIEEALGHIVDCVLSDEHLVR